MSAWWLNSKVHAACSRGELSEMTHKVRMCPYDNSSTCYSNNFALRIG